MAAAVPGAAAPRSRRADARPRVLLIAPASSYRTAAFCAAAQALGAEVVIASEGHFPLVESGITGLRVDFRDTQATRRVLHSAVREAPFQAVLGVDDISAALAAELSADLGLPHNPIAAVRIARRKDLARACLAAAGVRVPAHWPIDLTRPIAPQLEPVRFPCVAKPVALSASRGVIRADNLDQLLSAIARVQCIVRESASVDERNTLLIEEFVPGRELALEGILEAGRLTVLSVFDKPDPLDGPYFEETYYLTPSRESPGTQTAIADSVQAACAAYGLCEGPVHAECRVNGQGVWMIEVAARTIGGLCARLLRFGTGMGLEELVLAQALGRRPSAQPPAGGAGVLMIPIPQAGILRRVEGQLAARQVPFVEDVVIDIREGYELIPLPEGSQYLGFIFARAPSAAQAEAALRAAHACLRVVVAPLWKGTVS